MLPAELEFLAARIEATAGSLSDVSLQMRCRAALAALHGDADACAQHLAAAMTSSSEWDQAKRGELDY